MAFVIPGMATDTQGYVLPKDESVVPPDPTRRVLVWGKAYPCLQPLKEGYNLQCGGMMQRTSKRAYRFESDLWHHFKCDRCGRQADDRKVQ